MSMVNGAAALTKHQGNVPILSEQISFNVVPCSNPVMYSMYPPTLQANYHGNVCQ